MLVVVARPRLGDCAVPEIVIASPSEMPFSALDVAVGTYAVTREHE